MTRSKRVVYLSQFLGQSDTLLHTEKYFRNLIKSTRNQIVFIIFRLIWNTNGHYPFAVQSENGKYNLISF